jgi:hypothetical protein
MSGLGGAVSVFAALFPVVFCHGSHSAGVSTGTGLYARVPLLARAQDQRNRACKALAAARASGPEGAEKVCRCWLL